MEADPLKLEAQHALDELFKEGALPFKLQACRISEERFTDSYVVYFHDSRLHSVTVSWKQDLSFGDLIRNAVLDRVPRPVDE